MSAKTRVPVGRSHQNAAQTVTFTVYVAGRGKVTLNLKPGVLPRDYFDQCNVDPATYVVLDD